MVTIDNIFNKQILDPKGNNVTDINYGLKTYYSQMIHAVTHNCEKSSEFLAGDMSDGYPDLAAYSLYNSESALYWFLFSNFIENPFMEIKSGWAYYSYDSSVQSEAQSTSLTTSPTIRYGAVVTLN